MADFEGVEPGAEFEGEEPPAFGISDAETRRIWKAMMLAPTLEICDALLRREAVPVGRLDPGWATAFGLRAR